MKNDTTLLQKLKKYDGKLTKAERQLQEYVIRNIDTIKNTRILLLEKETGISKSTISRYCKKMGFNSFRDFAAELSAEVAINYANVHVVAGVGESTLDIANKLCVLEAETLKTTFRMLDAKLIDEAVKEIFASDIIHVFAMGGALSIAQDFCHKMLRIGKKTIMQYDFISQQMQAKTAQNGVLAFVFTISGQEQGMADIVDTLRQNGIKVICITNGFESAVAAHADISLYGAYRHDFTYTGTIESRLSLMYIVDLLFILLSMKGAPATTDSIRQTKEVLDRYKVKDGE